MCYVSHGVVCDVWRAWCVVVCRVGGVWYVSRCIMGIMGGMLCVVVGNVCDVRCCMYVG